MNKITIDLTDEQISTLKQLSPQQVAEIAGAGEEGAAIGAAIGGAIGAIMGVGVGSGVASAIGAAAGGYAGSKLQDLDPGIRTMDTMVAA